MASATKKATKKAPAKKAPGKKASAKKAPAKVALKRADLGAPVDGFFAAQPPMLRSILTPLRALIQEVAPTAQSSLKWGMPFYTLEGATLCALGAHKSHVNLILSGPPGTFSDPSGKLTGEGKTGRHLKLTNADQIEPDEVRRWLCEAVAHARK